MVVEAPSFEELNYLAKSLQKIPRRDRDSVNAVLEMAKEAAPNNVLAPKDIINILHNRDNYKVYDLRGAETQEDKLNKMAKYLFGISDDNHKKLDNSVNANLPKTIEDSDKITKIVDSGQKADTEQLSDFKQKADAHQKGNKKTKGLRRKANKEGITIETIEDVRSPIEKTKDFLTRFRRGEGLADGEAGRMVGDYFVHKLKNDKQIYKGVQDLAKMANISKHASKRVVKMK